MLQDFVNLTEKFAKFKNELLVRSYNGYKIKKDMDKVLVKKHLWECINLLLDIDDKLEKR